MRIPGLFVAVLAIPLLVGACDDDKDTKAPKTTTGTPAAPGTGATPKAGAPAPKADAPTEKAENPAPKEGAAPVDTSTVVARCTENMKSAAAESDRMKAFTGKEGPMCLCLVGKVKADTSLTDRDRALIYAGLQSKPGSDESKTAQENMTEASTAAVAAAMQACAKQVMNAGK